MKLKGHNKRIAGLAFSDVLNVLVSSGIDSQLCVWNLSRWEKQTSKQLKILAGRVSATLAETRVQFHKDQTHLLDVHETQIAVYKAPKLESPKHWFLSDTSGLITYATYSCDSQSIYVGFEDGSVGILASPTLTLRCRISSTAYLPNNPNVRVHPLVIAAHLREADQFALGLSNGGVCVLEPLESERKWGTSPPLENGAGPSGTTPVAASTNDQAQR
nr:topless-related protein 4-like isoform X1 [Tanacetum cinerariifolium]